LYEAHFSIPIHEKTDVPFCTPKKERKKGARHRSFTMSGGNYYWATVLLQHQIQGLDVDYLKVSSLCMEKQDTNPKFLITNYSLLTTSY